MVIPHENLFGIRESREVVNMLVQEERKAAVESLLLAVMMAIDPKKML